MIFAKDSIMKWNGQGVTDHNRTSLNVAPNRIEKSNRMANGTLRKYIIADKRTFTCSWENVPNVDAMAVDGFLAGRGIENFYNTVTDPFTLLITEGDGTTSTFQVVFEEFTKEVSKRGTNYDLWNVSISLEEV